MNTSAPKIPIKPARRNFMVKKWVPRQGPEHRDVYVLTFTTIRSEGVLQTKLSTVALIDVIITRTDE